MSLPRFSVRNPVLVNLLMATVLVGGAVAAFQIVREMFPALTPDRVRVTVIYPGASPEDIERSVARKIEDRIKDIEDVETLETTINEGACVIVAEARTGGRDIARIADDIDKEVKRIDTFPPDIEEPDVREEKYQLPVIIVSLYGAVSERQLKEAGERLERDLWRLPGVSETALSGAQTAELRVETDPVKLQAHNLSFAEVAAAVRRGNMDLPAGRLRAEGGDLLLRIKGESLRVEDLADIPIRADPAGGFLRVGDVARVVDDFGENPVISRYNGQRAVNVTVLMTRGQDAILIAEKIKRFAAENEANWRAQGLRVGIHGDLSHYVRSRLDLLTENALSSLLLVLLALALLLDPRVAFWVAMGLPISFLGSLLILHWLNMSLNMVSMLGLIIVTGMIVDDAIIIGENIHHHLRQGLSPAAAAIRGAEEVAWPVLAAVSTTMAAFVPLLLVEGRMGKMLAVLPVVVITALLASLLEALIVLPSHMAEWVGHAPRGQAGWGRRLLERTNRLRDMILDEWLAGKHERLVRFCLKFRWQTTAFVFCAFLLTVGLVVGQRVPFEFFPANDAELLVCNLELPEGSPPEETEKATMQVERLIAELPARELRSISTTIGNAYSFRTGSALSGDFSHLAQLIVELQPLDAGRTRSSEDILNQLRERAANVPGVKKLKFTAMHGMAGEAFAAELRAENLDAAREVAAKLIAEMSKYPALRDLENSDRTGKVEIKVRQKDSAAAAGLRQADIAEQVRAAFYGIKAQTLQRGQTELDVWVKLPLAARRVPQDLDQLRLALPAGGYVTLGQVAELEVARGYSVIQRADGQRTLTVTAAVDQKAGNTQEITTALAAHLEQLCQAHPGVSFRMRGEAEETGKTVGSLALGFCVAILLIYSILAGILRSYTQPLIVLTTVPLGIVGAVLGHWWMGCALCIFSIIGFVALSGIVVNNAILLVVFINRAVAEGLSLEAAVLASSRRRLRAILATSSTTALGLTPIMLETSFQARFLIPLVVSLAFGLLFSTLITLVLLPCLYLMRADLGALLRFVWTWKWERHAAARTIPEGNADSSATTKDGPPA